MTERASREVELADKRRYWRHHLDAWEASGLTQTEYCRQNDLIRHRFQYWKKRFRSSESSTAFIEIPVPSGLYSEKSPHPLRLIVGNQYQIAIERNFDPIALGQLIGVLDRL